MKLQEKIGQMIMVGFCGKYPTDQSVFDLQAQIEKGVIGGAIAFAYNIESPEQIQNLNKFLQDASPENHPLLIAVDQEGGRVQRLKSENGFNDYLSAKQVSDKFSPLEAEVYYGDLAREVSESGFNVNFTPVVDLDGQCPVIGKLERAFSSSPETVAYYGEAVAMAHRKAGVVSSLKHFPGHGFASGDTHKGFVDITETFDPQELEPFYKLVKQNCADMIMVGHQTHKGIDPNYPATLSQNFIGPLLRDKGYEGVVVSDDLHMGAILQFYTLDEIVVNAINAGIDILVFSSNPAAAGAYEDKLGSHDLSQIHEIVLKAVQTGDIPESRIHESYDRIMGMKKNLI